MDFSSDYFEREFPKPIQSKKESRILSGKNAQAWVSMVLYLKKINENENIKMKKKNPGSRLEVAC